VLAPPVLLALSVHKVPSRPQVTLVTLERQDFPGPMERQGTQEPPEAVAMSETRALRVMLDRSAQSAMLEQLVLRERKAARVLKARKVRKAFRVWQGPPEPEVSTAPLVLLATKDRWVRRDHKGRRARRGLSATLGRLARMGLAVLKDLQVPLERQAQSARRETRVMLEILSMVLLAPKDQRDCPDPTV